MLLTPESMSWDTREFTAVQGGEPGEYEDYHDALQQLGRLLDKVYMHKRIHSSLD